MTMLPIPLKKNTNTDEVILTLLRTFFENRFTDEELLSSVALLKKASQQTFVDKRKLKVGARSRPNAYNQHIYFPELNLRGNWLHQAGFERGDLGHVLVMNKLIIIAHEPRKVEEQKRKAYKKK